MTKSHYHMAVIIKNVKSFIHDDPENPPDCLSFYKPINVIVGANGGGKSNILYSAYHSFNKKLLTSNANNLTKKFSLFLHAEEKENEQLSNSDENVKKLPKFDCKEYLTIGKTKGEIVTTVFEDKFEGKGEAEKLASTGDIFETSLSFDIKNVTPSTTFTEKKLDFFDIFLLDSNTYDTFNKRLMYKISELSKKIKGYRERARCTDELADAVSKVVPEITDCEFEEGSVKDGYLNDFIDLSCLSAGFKKSLLIQHLCYLSWLKKVKNIKNFFNILLIDEIEDGLQLNRQQALPNIISSAIKENELKDNIVILLTTHSPTVYSSFSKIRRDNPELIDIFYVFRDEEGSSRMIKMDDISQLREYNLDSKKIEEAVDLELGLSIFDLPKVMIFVEGIDKYFLQGVLEGLDNKDDFKIHKCKGSPESQIWNFIEGHLLSNTRKVLLFFDKDSEEATERKITAIKTPINEIHTMYFEPTELEPFIFGKAEDEIKERENIEKVLDKLLAKIPEDDTHENERKIVEGIKRDLNKNQLNYEKIKSIGDLYFILGKYWKSILSNNSKKKIEEFLSKLE